MASSSPQSHHETLPCSPNSQSLLQKLKPNYDGNQSCHQCLRSKVTPSAQVVAMLEDNLTQWNAQILLQAHQSLLTNYVPLMSRNVESSMQAFGQWGTAFYFLQFILSLNGKNIVPPNQVIQMATQLIQSMTNELGKLPTVTTDSTKASQQSGSLGSSHHLGTQENNDEEDDDSVVLSQQDATQSLDRRLVACYCFQSLSRLNIFCQSQIAMVAPLWKGICAVAKASSIPSVLLEQAIQQVLKMLKEGCPRLLNTVAIVTASQQANEGVVPSFVMQGKLISFLALRLGNLMGTSHGTKKARSKAYKHLLLLQGMYLVTNGNVLPDQFQKACSEIATKTTKAMLEMIVEGDAIHRPALDALIPIAMSLPKDENDKIGELSYRGLHLAKVQLSIALLQKFAHVPNECLTENMHPLLVLCESLYSIFLPQAYGVLIQSLWWNNCGMAKQFVDASLQPMATILVGIDAALDNSKLLHRLLVRWLAPYRSNESHPLSTEVVLTVMHLFLMASSNNQALVSLMAKLLLDPRTETSLRQNLSRLMVTILASSIPSNGPLRALVLQQMEAEVQRIVPKGSKKRRRSSDKGISFQHYSLQDVKATTAVLVHLCTSSKNVTAAMQQLVQQLQGRGKENDLKSLKIAKVEWNCMVMALMQGSLLANPDRFQSQLGMSLLEFQRRLIVAVTSNKPSSSDERAVVKHCLLCSSILRFCNHVCNGFHENRQGATELIPIEELVRFLKHCTGKSLLVPKATSSKIAQCRSLVLFDAIRLMEAISFGIPADCPPNVVDTLKGIFVRLFSSNNWAVLSQAIGSLVFFGQRIDKSYQQLLPSCLPEAQQPLFRTRILSNRGQVTYRQYGETDLISLNIGKSLLVGHCEKREIGKSIFPSTSTMEIAPGSYFIQMPSQGGRHAWVVFEPGPESIQDIKYMRGLGEEDDTPEDIQKLKRALVVEKGGLNCLLQSL